MATAKKTNPRLWEQAKAEAVAKLGGHSARAMQLATKLYKAKGGKYSEARSSKNSLTKWTDENWGYVGGEKAASKPKGKKGRYLPEKARKALSSGEKSATSRAKNAGTRAGKKVVAQPKRIAAKAARYR